MFTAMTSYSQSDTPDADVLKPYSFYVTVGGPIYNHLSFAAEFAIPNTNRKFRVKPFYSNVSRDLLFDINDVKSTVIGADLVYLFGRKHAFEINAGVQTAISNANENEKLGTIIRGNIGYRLTYRSIVARAGFGLPDIFYLSVGFQF